MARMLIEGKTPLRGKIKVSGAKNEALKLIPFSIILDSPVKISNVPRITDVQTELKILESIGAKYKFEDGVLRIDSTSIKTAEIKTKLAKKLRASIVLAGPLLARFGKVFCPYPGGCLIGARPLDTHVDAFKQLGAMVRENKDHLFISLAKPGSFKVVLKERSVSATENIALYCAATEGVFEISNCAEEPEIVELMKVLKRAGAKIEGIGTPNLKITGNKLLHLDEVSVMSDRIEAATFIIALIATGGEGSVSPVRRDGLELFFKTLEDCGANVTIEGNSAIVKASPDLKPFKIKTGPQPEFPTDLQSPMSLVAGCANGVSTINETMFENRLMYLDELKKMGLKAEIISSHEAKIQGPSSFKATEIRSLDLRSGITMLIAAIMADGKTIIENSELIDRGYERVDEKFRHLGAKIKRL